MNFFQNQPTNRKFFLNYLRDRELRPSDNNNMIINNYDPEGKIERDGKLKLEQKALQTIEDNNKNPLNSPRPTNRKTYK
jgi:hypothetical protein